MKKVITLLSAIVITGLLNAQDSSQVKVSIPLEAGDIEYLYKHIYGREQTEDLYDQVKKKMNTQPFPTGTTLVTADTVTRATWVFVLDLVRRDPLAHDKFVFKHLLDAMIAVNDPYITYRIFKSNNAVNDNFSSDRKYGRDKYRRTKTQ